jgi:hypothetical protein
VADVVCQTPLEVREIAVYATEIDYDLQRCEVLLKGAQEENRVLRTGFLKWLGWVGVGFGAGFILGVAAD